MENIDIDIDKDNLKNIDIDIDIDMAILKNIDIDKGILQNIDIDKISYRLGFGISNTPIQERIRFGLFLFPVWFFAAASLPKEKEEGDHTSGRNEASEKDVVVTAPCFFKESWCYLCRNEARNKGFFGHFRIPLELDDDLYECHKDKIDE